MRAPVPAHPRLLVGDPAVPRERGPEAGQRIDEQAGEDLAVRVERRPVGTGVRGTHRLVRLGPCCRRGVGRFCILPDQLE